MVVFLSEDTALFRRFPNLNVIGHFTTVLCVGPGDSDTFLMELSGFLREYGEFLQYQFVVYINSI